MLAPQWDIMAFVHSQSRRRLAIGKLIYVVSLLAASVVSSPSALAAAAHVNFIFASLSFFFFFFFLGNRSKHAYILKTEQTPKQNGRGKVKPKSKGQHVSVRIREE